MFIVCQKRMLTLATGAVRQSGSIHMYYNKLIYLFC